MMNNGGELKVSLKGMEITSRDVSDPDMEPGLYTCLTVADTGMGMSKEVITNIFDPFFTTKEKGKGTGLGLSVVHGIVKSINGHIQVTSKPNKGTEFKIYIPQEKSMIEEREKLDQKPLRGGSEQILFVDDEADIVAMEKEILESIGYCITPRTRSLEVFEAFRAMPEKFDMVITDMAIPKLSGDKLTVEMIRINPDVSILLCTGFSEAISEEKALSIGIKGFILNPMVVKDLTEKIRDILDAAEN